VIEVDVLSLPSVAVIVAVWLEEMVPDVAVKVAEVDPAGTDTEAGTVSALLELASDTVVALCGTATLKVTVHVEVPLEFKDVGEQATDDNSGAANTGNVTTLLTKVLCAMVNWACGLVVSDEFNCR
jgi:hypothetical protein